MPGPEWQGRCDALAKEIFAACADILKPAETRLDDRTCAMLAEEHELIPPHHPIGLIYRYRVRERRVFRLFGRDWLPIPYWKTLLSFGLEEMFGSSLWTRNCGLWCAVDDDRLIAPARAAMERFCAGHDIKLDFAPRAA